METTPTTDGRKLDFQDTSLGLESHEFLKCLSQVAVYAVPLTRSSHAEFFFARSTLLSHRRIEMILGAY